MQKSFMRLKLKEKMELRMVEVQKLNETNI
jgi:hypothetical protein